MESPSQPTNSPIAAMVWTMLLMFCFLGVFLAALIVSFHPEAKVCPEGTLRYGQAGSAQLAFGWIAPAIFGFVAAIFSGPTDIVKIHRFRPTLILASLTLLGLACGIWLNSDADYYCFNASGVTSRDGILSSPHYRPLNDLISITPDCTRTRRDAYLSVQLRFRDNYSIALPVANWSGFYKDFPLIKDILAKTRAKWNRLADFNEGDCPPVASGFSLIRPH